MTLVVYSLYWFLLNHLEGRNRSLTCCNIYYEHEHLLSCTVVKKEVFGKNDRPDVHFVRSSAFIVRTTLSARFYPADVVLCTDGCLLHPCAVKLRPRGRGKNKK
jgi:hypothetical protein